MTERPKTRDELLTNLPVDSVGAELGVHCGAFSSKILRIVQPKRLYLVDLWANPIEWKESDGKGQWTVKRYTGVEAWSAVHERMQDFLTSGLVQLVCGEACRWLEVQPTASLDWVYLDDDHRADHVALELSAASRCVRPGGWILGHDYCEVFPSVVQAVDEFCRLRRLKVNCLTNEDPAPVYPRPDGMPAMCAFNSFAIRLQQ